jgi:lipopolysaccharide transport system permease protein
MYLTVPFERAWHHRELIRAVVRRELKSRFRGSMLGWVWAVAAPLVMLLAYTFIFSIALPVQAQNISITEYAGNIFCGLIVFNQFSELAYRAPMLLHEHSAFVKKSIFPSETIAWIASIRGFVYAGISFGVLLVFRLVTAHWLPVTILLTPLLILPFALLMLGIVWFLMGLGAFTKDVAHLMVSIVPIMMFATPIFYTLDQIPPTFVPWLKLNIVGDYIEMLRALVIQGQLPSLLMYVVCVAVSYVIFMFGYRFVMRYKSVIVDVI